jgi:hypothetical protein
MKNPMLSIGTERKALLLGVVLATFLEINQVLLISLILKKQSKKFYQQVKMDLKE